MSLLHLQQYLHHFGIFEEDGPMQRRHSVRLRSIHFDLLIKQRTDRGGVLLFNRVGGTSVFRLRG